MAGIYITNPIIKKTNTTLNLKFAFDYKDIYDYMLDSIRSQDKIRTITLGINHDTTDNLYKRARNIINLNYTRGIGGILGGSDRNDKQPGEAEDDYLSSIGAGIRIYYGKYFSARIDHAWPKINGKYENKNSETYLQMTVGF